MSPLRAAACLAIVALHGCKKPDPPLGRFEVKFELPPPAGSAAPVPPSGAVEPYRVWLNQETPRQKKTPEWQTVPAKESRVLPLSPDGKWRCVVTPAEVFGKADEDAPIAEWSTSRYLRCSSDEWRTHAEVRVRVWHGPDGKRVGVDPRAALYLNDIVEGKPRVTLVVLEGDPTRTGRTN